jgi:hypothetical protein
MVTFKWLSSVPFEEDANDATKKEAPLREGLKRALESS